MVHTFAAIDVGSFELTMKIYEYGGKKPMKEIDCLVTGLSLGADTYATGKISKEKVEELCHVLSHFARVMHSYKVEHYKAYGTSAIRETENSQILLDLIETRTGIHIDTLSNSEQRFLDYKSIAGAGNEFLSALQDSAAILDIGGGSIQISLFDEDSLVSTQNLMLGVLRIRERVESLGADPYRMRLLEEELIDAQLLTYKKLFLSGTVKNLIVMDDYISGPVSDRAGKLGQDHLTRKDFLELLDDLSTRGTFETARMVGVPEEKVPLIRISGLLVKSLSSILKTEKIYAPGVTLSDGMAYEFAEEHKIIKPEHDFEKDITACALNISRRYNGSRSRAETLRKISGTIFDAMKKASGLTGRDRLYLDIASILHDCGKYIAMTDIGERSYEIIMATEIIGLSHHEREIVASIVRFNHSDFIYSGMGEDNCGTLGREGYIKVAKLTAILRLANSLDRSHKQKLREVKASLSGNELLLSVETPQGFLLEEAYFPEASEFFEEIYSIRPVIIRN
ncbi:MAG: exopolyphosphatase [Lachnospiraceae bacterium]|nr:exopolyphosphatase [Lachnospiraceae bacterium]